MTAMFDQPFQREKRSFRTTTARVGADHIGALSSSDGPTRYGFTRFYGSNEDFRAHGITGARVLRSVTFKLLSSLDENGETVEQPIAVVGVTAGHHEHVVWFHRDEVGNVVVYPLDQGATFSVDDRFNLDEAVGQLELQLVQDYVEAMDALDHGDRKDPMAMVAEFKRSLLDRMVHAAAQGILAFEQSAAQPRPLQEVLTLVEAGHHLCVSTEFLRQGMDRGDLACLVVRDASGDRFWFTREALSDFWDTSPAGITIEEGVTSE
ncbi:hypothetical protein SAMN05216466_10688 [Paraburkholderia phenazinium]|uniref:Uncharacterized protein n=1 Tax=Paraburkholderia phenazinium TaxID=60549 RepID=A0A1G7Y977_9BURK|nr:hypothetical protein [Paraburkholderia phenazinium]SDG92927.1 hypothetical protein SAMN05216466_10688 [Paraburkholderia phenazinium]